MPSVFKQKKFILDSTSRIIAFVGVRGGVGVTTYATHLAARYAESGKYVLYIDFRFDNPVAFRYFGVDASQLKAHTVPALRKPDVSIDDILVPTKFKKIKLVSATDITELGANMETDLNTCEMLIKIASAKFDVVILDCDPLVMNETTTAALRRANYVFTVADPDVLNLAQLLKMKAYTNAVTGKDKMQYVLVNKVIEREFTQKQIESIGMQIFSTNYYSNEISKYGLYQELMDTQARSSNKATQAFKDTITELLLYTGRATS